MKLKEIVNMQDQLDLLCLIVNSTLTAIRQQAQMQPRQQGKVQPRQQARKAPPPKAVKPIAVKPPKPAPYAAPPKPLPKAKPQPLTATQIKNQQLKRQQDYANVVKKNLNQDNTVKMPKSLQPLTRNVISPIGGADQDLNKKLELAKQQGEQNRSNGSLPR